MMESIFTAKKGCFLSFQHTFLTLWSLQLTLVSIKINYLIYIINS